jgi:hypothetical protein
MRLIRSLIVIARECFVGAVRRLGQTIRTPLPSRHPWLPDGLRELAAPAVATNRSLMLESLRHQFKFGDLTHCPMTPDS